VEPLLVDARSGYEADRDLHRVALNAVSWVEANLAVECLAETISQKALVTVANIREAIKELPGCPLAMPMDFEGLARVWELEREGHAWRRTFADEAGEYSILLLGDGNYCYDIVVRADGRTLMWMPRNRDEDFLNPDVIDLMMQRPGVLRSVIDLLQTMGLSFYPAFYLSLEDWRQEYAQTMFDEVVELFSTEAEARKRAEREEPGPAETRYRGMSNDGGISWLF
jgi:hypothetical protein